MLCGADLSNFTMSHRSGWLVIKTPKHSMQLKIYNHSDECKVEKLDCMREM